LIAAAIGMAIVQRHASSPKHTSFENPAYGGGSAAASHQLHTYEDGSAGEAGVGNGGYMDVGGGVN
jgi:hypothetical protein